MNTRTPSYGVSKALRLAVPVAPPYHHKYPLQNLSKLDGVTPFDPSHYGDGPLKFLVEKYGGKRKHVANQKEKRKITQKTKE